jgi:alpha-tubulin suppressor-like RCC1 family protein
MSGAKARAPRILARALLWSAGVWPGVSAAQDVVEASEQVKPLLVMIACSTPSGVESFGAGIIVSVENARVWIATAAHVVRECQGNPQVRFRSGRAARGATVPQALDDSLDLAALLVTGVNAAELPAIPLDRLGDPSILRRGDPLYLVGNPNGEEWSASDTPDRMLRAEGDVLHFSSTAIALGHSGGALLNDRWEVVGLIVADSRTGRAVSITRVVEALRSWKVPVALRVPHVRISAGEMRTCVVTAAGDATCWGNIVFEPPGTYDSVLALRGVRFKSISAGLFHACGIAFSGAAYCVGLNSYGQLGNGSTTSSQETPVPVQGGLVFSSVTVGGWHTCGLTPDGSAFCWGAGGAGRLGNGAGADSHIPLPVAGGLTFKVLSLGLRNTCGVATLGAAYCWGGMLGTGVERGGADPPNAFVPTRLGGNVSLSSISAGQDFGCGLGADGAAYCWGENEDGQLGNGSNTASLTDGAPVPVRVAGGHAFAALTAGLGHHACGLTTTGTAYCWGWNEDGQLGNGTTSSSNAPVAVAGGVRFASITVGHFHTCAVSLDGGIYCWGATRWSGMGTGSRTGSTRPVPVPRMP